MGATAHMFLPVFDRLQVATSYQYLELRFLIMQKMDERSCIEDFNI